MANDRIAELRLDSFKSYKDVVIAFEPLTILIGRNGGGSAPELVQAAQAKVGTGDLSILAEMRAFTARTETPSALPVELWTLDAGLKAFT